MKQYARWLLACLCLALAPLLHAAPLVEIRQDAIALPLSPYIDVLEDPDRSLHIQDVISERHGYRFASAPLTELYFGYTASVYWIRFTVENRLASRVPLILDITPADLDYLDVHEVDPVTKQLLSSWRTGSALPFQQRAYRHPLYFFDIDVPPGAARTYYVRVESNKTINLQMQLNSWGEQLSFSSERDRGQGLLIGGLLVLAILHLGLFAVFRFKGFLWGGLFLSSVLMIQVAWNGYLLPWFAPDDLLLDRQIIAPIYLAMLFSSLFAQAILDTRHRVRWQHQLLTVFAFICLAGSILTWFVPSYGSSIASAVIALLNTVVIFALALHANMEGSLLARYFLFARTFTTAVILIAIFNIHGYMPQGAFTAWGVTAVILVEAIIMLVVMVARCLQDVRRQQRQPTLASPTGSTRSLINLSDICHELRTPVSGILGMTDLLLEANLTEQQRNQVKTVRKSGQALLDVTNRISDLSQIESGAVELSLAPFELTSMIEACVENCRSRAESSNLELIYHVDAMLPLHVMGDAGKLQQVIINMLNFALRHLEKGEVILNVLPGMPGEIIFSIRSGNNTLIDRTLSTEKHKLGASDQLNITIAEQYLLLMGSALSLHTHIGEGVSISFQVMLDEAPVPVVNLTQEPDTSLQGKRMLVVDDNATCCTIIEQQAIQWGMSVTSAYGGKEALAILRSGTTLTEPFDIVLTDYDMPGMNGLELAHNIREDRKIHSDRLLIVMLTGLSHAPARSGEDNQDIQAVLYKPISGKSLRQALQSALTEHLQRDKPRPGAHTTPR